MAKHSLGYDDIDEHEHTGVGDGGDSISPRNVSIGQAHTRLHTSLNTDVPSATSTKVEWDTTAEEDSDVATSDLTNDEITVQQDGDYHVAGQFRWNNSANWNTGDEIRIYLKRNGTTFHQSRLVKVATTHQNVHTERLISLSSGDALSVVAYHGNANTISLANFSSVTNFSVAKVA